MSAEKLDRILEILTNSMSLEDDMEIEDGIICTDEFNSTAHAYGVYTRRLESLEQENQEVKQLMSELNDEEMSQLYDDIWNMARGHVNFIVINYDDICDDDEEEELWM